MLGGYCRSLSLVPVRCTSSALSADASYFSRRAAAVVVVHTPIPSPIDDGASSSPPPTPCADEGVCGGDRQDVPGSVRGDEPRPDGGGAEVIAASSAVFCTAPLRLLCSVGWRLPCRPSSARLRGWVLSLAAGLTHRPLATPAADPARAFREAGLHPGLPGRPGGRPGRKWRYERSGLRPAPAAARALARAPHGRADPQDSVRSQHLPSGAGPRRKRRAK